MSPIGIGIGISPVLGRIAPLSGDIYAIEGNSPLVVADFVNQYYRVGGDETTLASMFAFSRTGSAWYLNSSGVWTEAATGVARVGHHVYESGAWVNKGLLVESAARTNLLLNSGTLSTQNVTTSATPYTLSFSGTGTVTLSGTSTAGPLVGTGTGENNRVNLTFTPTAGTLTLTVSGTVTNAQLEAGSTPSSYIPTAGTAVTRNAETVVIDAANLSYSASGISIQMNGLMTYADTNNVNEVWLFDWESGTNYVRTTVSTSSTRTGDPTLTQRDSVAGLQLISGDDAYYSPGRNVPFNFAQRHTPTAFNLALEGTALTAGVHTALPNLSSASANIGEIFMGTIGRFCQWDADLGDTGIEAASSWNLDVTAPTISSLSPADNAIGIAVGANLVATFDEDIVLGTGNIVLVETGVGTVETFNVATGLGDNGGTVSASGTQVTINPGADLSNSTAYHVTIAATAVDDTSGNSFAGIADTTTWNFTTVTASAFIPSRDFSDARNTIYVVI